MDSEVKRRRWIVHKKQQGWETSKVAAHLRISERTVLRWWRAYKLHAEHLKDTSGF